MGLGGFPRAARAVARDARHARHPHRQLRDGQRRPDRLRRRPLRRPHHGQALRVRAARQVRPHRHRPGRDLQERPGAHPDRRRRQGGAAEADQGVPGARRPTARASTRGGSSIRGWQKEYPLGYERSETGEIKPQAMVEAMYKATEGDAIITSDVGQHQMWAAQYYDFDKPRRWINSGGLGTMGFGLPAAIGAKVAKPDDDGRLPRRRRQPDHDLPGARDRGAPRDPGQGLPDEQRLLRHGPPVAGALLGRALLAPSRWARAPTGSKLAEAFGATGMRVDDAGEVEGAMRDALATEGPVLLDVQRHPRRRTATR